MTRRRPQKRVAFIPIAPGADFHEAVLDKAARAAVAAVAEQSPAGASGGGEPFAAFIAGYLLGFARQVARRDGVDCEALGEDGMARLRASLGRALPAGWGIDLSPIGFASRRPENPNERTGMRLSLPGRAAAANGGYLVGHLEALCGSRKLVRQALMRMAGGGGDAAAAFLTDCDLAADPMQTRLPTLSLRFHGAERDMVRHIFNQHAES